MSIKDLFKMASSNLKRHKSRTFLTVLGIVIGTMSIIMMVALGLGMQESFAETIEDLGSVDIITVTKGDSVTSTTRLSEQTTDDELTDLDLEFFKSIENVQLVTPVITQQVKLVSGEYENSVSIIGLDMTMFEDMGYVVVDEQEVSDNRIGMIFGQDAAEGFDEVEITSGSSGNQTVQGGFGGPPGGMGGGRPNMTGGPGGMGGPRGGMNSSEDEEEELDVDIFTERITMSLDTSYSPMNQVSSSADVYRVQALGLLEEGDFSRDRNIYMDIDALMELIEDYEDEEPEGYSEAYIKIADTSYSEDIVDTLEYYGYSAQTSADMVETVESTTQMLQIALGAIGGISLIVAAIGITNTMIMAITERKKEIGVMKVIGATITDIKRIFLLEATIIGFIGGVVGVGLSFAITTIVTSNSFSAVATGGGRGGVMNPTSSLMSLNFSLPPTVIVLGVVFTTLVGLISGYLPARKAMASSALEALHSE